MKAIKIIIVAVLVAALGFGIYNIINPVKKPVVDYDEKGDSIVIPDGCDLDWDQQYIDSVYKAIPIGQFQLLKQRRNEMTANYNNVMMDSLCKETVKLILRNRYISRFVVMVNSEFEGKNWPHYSDIKDMNNALLSERSQENPEKDLKMIEKICNEYGQVMSYNYRVRSQSYQRPSMINDHWNFSNTRSLINSTPSASAPVDHTAQYESSRQGNVKNSLYNGHVAFLEKLVDLARQEIMDNNTESHYNSVFDIVTKEIEQFKTNAESLYGKSYSSVNSTAERLTKEIKSYESLLN